MPLAVALPRRTTCDGDELNMVRGWVWPAAARRGSSAGADGCAAPLRQGRQSSASSRRSRGSST